MDYWIMPVVWGALMIAFSFVEAITTAMVSCWFAIGSALALVASLLHLPIFAQIILFVLGSLVSFILIHKKIIRIFQFQHTPDGADIYLGKTGIVTEPIEPDQDGRVLIEGRDWKASCKTSLKKGEKIRTVGLHGVTMQVVPAACGKETTNEHH